MWLYIQSGFSWISVVWEEGQDLCLSWKKISGLFMWRFSVCSWRSSPFVPHWPEQSILIVHCVLHYMDGKIKLSLTLLIIASRYYKRGSSGRQCVKLESIAVSGPAEGNSAATGFWARWHKWWISWSMATASILEGGRSAWPRSRHGETNLFNFFHPSGHNKHLHPSMHANKRCHMQCSAVQCKSVYGHGGGGCRKAWANKQPSMWAGVAKA